MACFRPVWAGADRKAISDEYVKKLLPLCLAALAAVPAYAAELVIAESNQWENVIPRIQIGSQFDFDRLKGVECPSGVCV